MLKFTFCFHKWKRWINHSDHKTRPFGEVHDTESLFSDNQLWPQQICWASNWKICFLTTDLRVIMAICRATQRICFLTTTHGHLPSPSYKTFFPDDTGFSYLLLNASRSKYMHLCRNHTHFKSTFICWIHDCMHAHEWCNLTLLWGAKLANKSIWKILNTNWIVIALH